ncbi:MAG: L-seryl-tRNA(Sec) selenium transferase [Coriobacteriia bacterium]
MTAEDPRRLLRSLPKVDDLLKREDVTSALVALPRGLVVDSLRQAISERRERVLAGDVAPFTEDDIASEALAIAQRRNARSLRRVVNATGIVVHTNLGRSILAPAAIDAVAEVAGSYSTLEYDVPSGERGSRHVHVESLICELTGAEAAMAVNNNASAVLMALAALAQGREVIVSRGQLVEIGGSFRIPDIMAASGATMVEVGTTNKTHLRDYEQAVTERTALLLKVHSSNYRMVGFTQEVPLEDLVALGAERGIPVYEDQGSGVLVDLAALGLPYEPTMSEAIKAGADLVSGSGDKLLGGPQAGILAGKAEIIERLKTHPLARVVRLDKMTLAALEVTLALYRDPEKVFEQVPTLRMLTMTKEEVGRRAEGLAAAISERCPGSFRVEVVPETSRAGGGALPMADIPTCVVALTPVEGSVVELEQRLRMGSPPVVGRIKDDRLLLDPRTLTVEDEQVVVEALAALVSA